MKLSDFTFFSLLLGTKKLTTWLRVPRSPENHQYPTGGSSGANGKFPPSGPTRKSRSICTPERNQFSRARAASVAVLRPIFFTSTDDVGPKKISRRSSKMVAGARERGRVRNRAVAVGRRVVKTFCKVGARCRRQSGHLVADEVPRVAVLLLDVHLQVALLVRFQRAKRALKGRLLAAFQTLVQAQTGFGAVPFAAV